MLVGARPRWDRPALARRLRDQFPASGAQGRAGLALERVGPQPAISEREGRPRSCAVEERASVLAARGAQARHLERAPVIATAADRAANDHHADDLVMLDRGDAEFVTDRR